MTVSTVRLPAPDLPAGPRSALVIATTTYDDPLLRQLRAPATDALEFAAVLADPTIGGFQVTSIVDRPAHEVRIAIDEFLDGRTPEDLVVVYFSCHGVTDHERSDCGGWAWLTAHGLVAWNSTQSDPNAYRVTRLGEQTLKDGGARLVAAERLGVSLHHRIAQQVEEQFLLGQYDLAVFAALRDVEDRVRKLAEAPNSLLGVKLMQQAFSLNGPGPLVYTAADPGEQEAAMNLFKGAIGLFKNPTSHRAVSYDNPVIASDIILLADLLLRLLDQVDRRLNDEPD